MRSVLSALVFWFIFGSAVFAQTAACSVLSRMRQADVAIQTVALRGGGGTETQAAMLRLIRQDGPASGLDPDFVAAFVSAQDAALAALTGGARAETVLSDPDLRASGARVSRYFSLFQCSNDGGISVASVSGARPLDTEGEGADRPGPTTPGAVAGAASGATAAPLVDGSGGSGTRPAPGSLSGGSAGGSRFPEPGSLGEDPWRADTQPWVYRFLSIFFLAFAAVLGVIDWMRRIRHRRAERHPCALPAAIRRRDNSFDGAIVELSHVGAEIRLDGQPLRRGVQVTVDVKGLRLGARVVWVNAHFIGVSFTHALDNATHEALLAAAMPQGPEPVLAT